jgi:glycosyltransferase involved in cell wall biosynthesis
MIASHINIKDRLDLLESCLDSLLGQSKLIPVLLSISFASHRLRKAFAVQIKERFETSVTTEGEPFLTIFNHRTTQLAQFKHYDFLMSQELSERYDWIMFCDDDDTYHHQRVEVFYNCLGNRWNAGAEGMKNSHLYESYEYWQYIVSRATFQGFFDDLRAVLPALACESLLRNEYADMLLGTYLKSKRNLATFVLIGQTTELMFRLWVGALRHSSHRPIIRTASRAYCWLLRIAH